MIIPKSTSSYQLSSQQVTKQPQAAGPHMAHDTRVLVSADDLTWPHAPASAVSQSYCIYA